MMKIVYGLAVLFSLLATKAAEQTAPFKEAERLYSEGSYSLAHEAYVAIADVELSADEKRWRQFRLAETSARSEAASRQTDDSALQEATKALRQFVADDVVHDRVWAEAHETLGDLQRGVRANMDLGGAWSQYEQALDYWAGSTNRVLAADKYWAILRKAAEPTQVEPLWYYGAWGTPIPLQVLENALKIARNEEEQARAHFMIAMTLRSRAGEWEQRFRIPEEFEAALKLKKDTRWYDDALYFYGEWMSGNGRAVQDEDGNWRTEPDYEKALELFQRLTSEFRKGETPWFDNARNRVTEITRESVDANVSNTFLPGSEIEFHLSTRNVSSVEFTLYSVDAITGFSFSGESSEWQHGFSPERAKKVKTWKKPIEKKRPYTPSSETIRLSETLPAGTYVLVAEAGSATDREMLLVTDAAVVMEAAGQQVLIYACDSGSGAPLGGSQVVLWERYYDGSRTRWSKQTRDADVQGLALFELKTPAERNPALLASIKSGDKQALSYGSTYYPASERDSWKIYAFPDKPAYRPGEKVQWKVIARRHRGESYTVPSGEKLTARFVDPRGADISKESLSLNDFGSAWGSFTLKEEMPLGEYAVVFLDADGRQEIGRSVLFRLEEYKLPEFKVSVRTPEENGRKKTFLLGESVEVELLAEYYSGGPVAHATAEVVITQAPYYHLWQESREFDWLYETSSRQARFLPRPSPGQVVQRETVQTDADGKARVTFHTPLGAGNDLEYRIEARVTDASRREITGSDRVRVGQQRFYVYPRPAHKIYQPQDKVEVEFRVLDANDQPLAAEGTVRVTRDYWFEVWLSPENREVQGAELKQLQSGRLFPPPAQPGQKPWRLKFRGYQQDQILTRTIKSDTNGIARLNFTPERDGYYRVAWRSDEPIVQGKIPSRPIRAETTVWVASTRSAEIGYHSGRFEILVDKETFRAGQKAAVMLSAPDTDRYVLLTTGGGSLLDYQLVHLDGSVKLLQFDITEKHVPNFFINGTMVADREISTAREEIVVPPVKNFLNVEVEAQQAEYRPGDRGTLRVQTRDSEGSPISAEIALTVFDESISYIQQDLAQDPRQFFFGTKRGNILNSYSSFQYRPYRRLVSAKENDYEVMEREALYDRRDGGRAGLQGGTAPASYELSKAKRSLGFNVARQSVAMDSLATIELRQEVAMPALAAAAAVGEEPAVQVRSDFRSAVFWDPALRTDQNGRAEVSFTYPETLTAWKAVARVVTRANQFGVDDALTRTRQPLSVRLQAPRFFLAGDTVTVSAVVNNNTSETLTVEPLLEAEGLDIPAGRQQALSLKPGEERRADWVLHPLKPGEVTLKVQARGGRYADAMEKTYPVYEHGIEKFLSISGKSKGDSAVATLNIPAERKAGSTAFSVQVTPSLAVTMLDALPYLVNFPYGCTEQTMSRFLPAVITAKTLKDLGLNPEDVLGRAFGGIEKKKAPQGNLGELDDVTRKGLARLYDFQHGDGGWGWWKDGESDRFMTAYVVWGMALAKGAGVEVKNDNFTRAIQFLNNQLAEAERDYDLQAFMLHALGAASTKMSAEQQTAFENLWEHRDRLNAYTRSLFALAANELGKKGEAQTLVRNLANGVKRDNSTGLPTAHWGEDGLFWRWSDGGVEATAFALRALLAIDPKNELVDPVANWLIKNRRGAQWSNTRDTAIVLLALNDYLRVTGEVKSDLEYELFVNDHSVGTRRISGADVFAAPRNFVVPDSQVKDGANQIRIARKSGEAPIYFAVECTFFSLEEPVKPAGNEIFVQRRYFRITPVPTLLKGYTYTKQELAPGDSVASGERIETVLTIEAKNNYEYLVFEDLKASGVEAVQVRSGEALFARQIRSSSVAPKLASAQPSEPILQNDRTPDETGHSRWIYQELRDRKVALFIDKLPEGFWEIRYESRAEIPGQFHALPVIAHAMYVPEIRANSAETRIVIYDQEKGNE